LLLFCRSLELLSFCSRGAQSKSLRPITGIDLPIDYSGHETDSNLPIIERAAPDMLVLTSPFQRSPLPRACTLILQKSELRRAQRHQTMQAPYQHLF